MCACLCHGHSDALADALARTGNECHLTLQMIHFASIDAIRNIYAQNLRIQLTSSQQKLQMRGEYGGRVGIASRISVWRDENRAIDVAQPLYQGGHQ
jgi:hypothetical protein